MRDIIWTLIVIWLVYKIVAVFKTASAKKSATTANHSNFNEDQHFNNTSSGTKKDIKAAVKKHVNNEGEYVDFEEVK